MMRLWARMGRRGRMLTRRRPQLEGLETRRVLTTPGFTAAAGFGGTDVVLNASATDSAGNTYVVGGFSGTVDMDPGVGISNLSSAGGRDAFVAKYSPTGDLLWANRYARSAGNDVVYDIVLDAQENPTIVGAFAGTSTFGATTLTSKGTTDAFAAKLDPSGNVSWVTGFGGTGFDQSSKVVLDSSGNLYVAGLFQSTVNFGPTTLTSQVGSYDVFTAKLGPTGSVAWVSQMGGASADQVAGIGLDTTGNIYVAGSYQGTATFGSRTLTTAGGYDAFLSELTPQGATAYAVGFGGTGTDQAKDLAVDGSGNAYVAGFFAGTAAFGGTTLNSTGLSDGFAAKVATGGAVSWVDDLGGAGDDRATAITQDGQGNLYVGGYYSGSATLGSTTLTGGGGTDGFVARLDSTGAVAWSQGFGGATNDGVSDLTVFGPGNVKTLGTYGGPAIFSAITLPNIGSVNAFSATLSQSISPAVVPTIGFTSAAGLGGTDVVLNASATDSAGNVYVVGGYSGTVDVDPGVGITNLTSSAGRDILVAKYSSTGALVWAKSFHGGTTGNDVANDIQLDGQGNPIVIGGFVGTGTFGSFTLTNQGSSDVFVTKLDASGNVTWAVGFGGAGYDVGSKLTRDGAGNILIAGLFQGTANFGSTSLVSQSGSYDIFAAKLGATGTSAWAVRMGGASADQLVGIGTDTAGNVYLSGSFQGTASFGSVSLATAGGYDAFVTGLNPQGVTNYAVSFGGTGTDQAKDLVVDGSGNAYAVGLFTGTASFGGQSLTSLGQNDGFAVKVGPTGVVGWASDIGGAGDDRVNAVTRDGQGNLYVAGYYSGSMTLGTTGLIGGGGTDGFAAKLDAAGNAAWAQGFGGAGNDTASNITVDGSGNLELVGGYAGPVLFGAITLPNIGSVNAFFATLSQNATPPPPPPAGFTDGFGGTDVVINGTVTDSSGNTFAVGGFSGTVDMDPSSGTSNLTSTGGRDAFVAKYDSTGALVWAKSFGGATGADVVNDLALDAQGNLIVAGAYVGSATFGGVSLTGKGSSDTFVAKLDASGNVTWAKGFGGTGYDQVARLALDGSGNIYLAGLFQGAATYGATTLNSQGGSYDIVVAKLDASGNGVWAVALGGSSTDQVGGIGLDTAGNVYLSGSFQGTATFGSNTLTSRGGYDAFVTQLTPAGVANWAVGLGGTGNDQAKDLAVDGTGNAYVVGQFTGTATFGATSLTSAGLGDAFAVRVGSAGTIAWAVGMGGTGDDRANTVALKNGNLYVGGSYTGNGTFGASSLTASGGTDAFVTRLAPGTGASDYAQSVGGAGNDAVTDVSVDGSGNVTLAGSYVGSAIFGTTSLPNIGSVNAFLYKRSKP